MKELNWYNISLWIFFLFFLLIFLKAKQQRRYKKLAPSPPGLPILGHLHLLRKPLHETLHALSKKYGPIFLIHLGTRRLVVVTSVSAVEECFTTNDVVLANRPRSLTGKYLNYDHTTVGFAPYGDHWRNLRRVITLDMLSAAQLAATFHIRRDEVQLMVGQIMKECTRRPCKVELKSRFDNLMYGILTAMVAGKRLLVDDAAEAEQFLAMLKEQVYLSNLPNPGDVFPALNWVDFRGLKRKMVRLMQKIDKFLDDLISEHRRSFSDHDELNEIGVNGKTLLRSLLLQQKAEPGVYTDDSIKGIIMTMIISGVETTSSAIEWTMSLLLNHPEAMARVKAEMEANQAHDCLLKEEDLKNLNYLQSVIKESLRLYPPGPLLLPHLTSQDCTIGGFLVPQGTALLVNAWAIQRDPEEWENPTKFMPERFEGGEGERQKWIPFGTGRRGCPGVGLANRTIALAVGSLIQAFEWERVGGEEVDMAAYSNMVIMHKLKPLEAICRPHESVINYVH